MVTPLPLPDLSHAYVDQANRPSKDFYNWLKSLRDSVSSMSSSSASGIDWISVKSSPFNAQGDGVSNDTVAFNDCYAFCAANNLGMYIPHGQYPVDGLTWDQGVNVIGAGSKKAVLIPTADNITTVEIVGVPPDRRDRIVEIGHFSAEATTNNNIGFHIWKANQFHFRDLSARDMVTTGFWVEGGQYCIYDFITASTSDSRGQCGVRITDNIAGGDGGGNNLVFNNLNIQSMFGVGLMVGRSGLPFPMGVNTFVNPVIQACAISSSYFVGQEATTVIGATPEGNGTGGASLVIFGENVFRSTVHCVSSHMLFQSFRGSDGPNTLFRAWQGSSVGLTESEGAPFDADPTSQVSFQGRYGNGATVSNVLLDLDDPMSTTDAASLGMDINASTVVDESFPNTFPGDCVAPTPSTSNAASDGFDSDNNLGLVSTVTFNPVAGSVSTNRVQYLSNDVVYPVASIIYLSFLIQTNINGAFGIACAQTQLVTTPQLVNGVWTRIFMKNLNSSGVTRSNTMQIWPEDDHGATIKVCRFISVVNPTPVHAKLLSRDHRFNPRNKNGLQHRQPGPPAFGTWALGDIIWNDGPTSPGFIGWVCTASGSPGTWKTWGPVS